MNYDINKIPFQQLLTYATFGALLFVAFYIVNHYIVPTIKGKRNIVKKYWQKIEIISWLVFCGFFFIALLRANVLVTLTFTALILGVGWDFWKNIFSGIVIKLNNRFKIGETISTDFATGKLRNICLAQSELINESGELVVVPNHKLNKAVLKHLYKKSNIQTHTFLVSAHKNETLETIHQKALNCPFISANQKIEVERTPEEDFLVKASAIDAVFIDKINRHFSAKKETV